ncbi:2-oxo-4-hydroxy-4-carboxy-5-ureidoimidazoline decarboxylase [Arthrobacter sp. RAF14]|uniref:2-oxo-4-hydroxy-4-carboxy-5-ureidoimidazoline decarboxylase n=1 Tax=Arthrobacter sp. RAF14 TaxID=3233051 RepID=UPI003F8E9515
MKLDAFNALSREDAIAVVRPCLDIQRWIEAVVDARPYASVGELSETAGSVAHPFTAEELESALAHHPRIGERAKGDSKEASLSRNEQSAVDPDDREVQDALAEGNAAYDRKFGRVFLIRAAGRSAQEILAALNVRLGNTPEEEDIIVTEQLRQIAVLRLEGAVEA